MLTFIETKLFTRLVDEYLGEDGLLALQGLLTLYPKNVSENISAATLKRIKATIDG